MMFGLFGGQPKMALVESHGDWDSAGIYLHEPTEFASHLDWWKQQYNDAMSPLTVMDMRDNVRVRHARIGRIKLKHAMA